MNKVKQEILNLSLLYVEDEEDTRIQLAEVFKYKVKNLFVAKDGLEALNIFKENKIHFIVSDFLMPKMNGNELCSAAKEIDNSVCFVLLSAYNDSNILINSIEAGVDKFLQKPIKADKLFTTIDNIQEKLISKFQLEKAKVCLKEAEKIALLSYWDVNLDSKSINFSKDAKKLFNVVDDDTDVEYKSFSKIVVEEERLKFLEIFEKRIYEEDYIDEIIAIDKSKNKYRYIHIVAKKWIDTVCQGNNIIGMFQDISYHELQKRKFLKDSQSDPMLNIANKKLLMTELQELICLSKRYDHPIGAIFFDIDNFKKINDTNGHLIADNILKELVDLIKKNIRKSDIFGRWGGDEFVIVTSYSNQDATISLAEKLLNRIKVNEWTNNIVVTVSMGIAFYREGDDEKSLLSRADTKMFKIKKDGKNGYNF